MQVINPLSALSQRQVKLLSNLIAVSATDGTVIAVVEVGTYAMACTDTIDVNSGAPPAVPSEVGYAVAAPLLPDTATVPYQVPVVVGENGAPAAAVEKVLEPLKTLGLLSKS